jgi:hypothetical protein
MDRMQAQTNIIQLINRINGTTSPWDASYTFNCTATGNVYDRELFIDQINAFPCVMLTTERVQVSHIGAGIRYNTLSFQIRGITWDEDAGTAGEALADDIEHVIKYARQEYPAFDEVRIDTIQTDEGINAPLGAVILQGIAVYSND